MTIKKNFDEKRIKKGGILQSLLQNDKKEQETSSIVTEDVEQESNNEIPLITNATTPGSKHVSRGTKNSTRN